MTGLLVLLYLLLTLAGGGALLGLINTGLSLWERSGIALVAGLLFGAGITYGLGLLFGLGPITVLGGPFLLLTGSLASSWQQTEPQRVWKEAWWEVRARWARRVPWFSLVALGAGIAAVTAIFGHTLFYDSGGLVAGYPTVWADWAQHLTTAASFAVGGNIPPTNPLFSGTSLLYPFLPDFHAAMMMSLGVSPTLALAVPGGALVVVIGVLVVALGRRLGLGVGAGIMAVLICFIGGGLGFVGIFSDACISHGFTATQCTLQYVVGHPNQALGIIGGTLHNLPGLVAAQPRAYDGLPADGGPAPFTNSAWYTPLMAWWLPQRTLLFGFAAAVSVLILVLAAGASRQRSWGAFALAGGLMGLLPIVHVQTLIALSILLLVLLWRRRRREWLALLGVGLVIGGGRLLQLLAAQHGAATGLYGDNTYPWLDPGWIANTTATARLAITPANLFSGAGQAVGQLFSGQWWGFWLTNLGVAVPLSLIVVILGCLRLIKGKTSRMGYKLTAGLPGPLLELAVGALLILAACNLFVFQTWNWDNTKLLVYWYLVIGLVIGALASYWWRFAWAKLASVALVAPVLLTGFLVVLRLLPWTPSANAITGPYTIASVQDLQMAAQIEAKTAPGAVFLNFGLPNDPVLAVAGRIGVMGYAGWLWSYGIDFGNRYADVVTLYNGCTVKQTDCPVAGLLQKYQISYVEVNNQVTAPGAIDAHENLAWWGSQGFPVVAKTSQITIYDVRGLG